MTGLRRARASSLGDIDAAVRMGVKTEDTGARDGDQMEMFGAGALEIGTRKKTVEPRTSAQADYVRNLFSHELAFGIGPAGTGKTYLAVAVAVNQMINGHVDKIILSRPAVEAGERLGFLPGDMKEKVDPYMQPLYDALHDFLPGKQLAKLIEEKTIEIAPLAFMRGRTLSNAYVVLDEAQNATSMQMKMFLTRLGQGSRMVITGDRSQVDLPRGQPSGLIEAERILEGIGGISFNYFTSKGPDGRQGDRLRRGRRKAHARRLVGPAPRADGWRSTSLSKAGIDLEPTTRQFACRSSPATTPASRG
jgi:phosphate starvation-inducible PhoH-like protein